MPDFIETLAFEEMSLVSREHSSIEAIRVWRDNNYNLKTCMRLKSGSINPFQGDAISIVEQMIGASRTLNLTDSGPGFLRVQLRGIVIESSQVGDGFAEIAGSVGSLRREYGSEAIGAPTFAIAWFVNSPQELLFPDSSQLKGRTTEVYTWGEFASDSYEHEGPWRAARNVIQLQYDGVSFLFGKTSKEHPGSFPCSFIRFHHHEHLPKAREIAGVLSFALGLSLIPIGETTFNAASSPVSTYFRSSFEGALRRIVDLPQRPIVPVRAGDVVHLGHNPVIALNQLLEGYAQEREKYELGKILWYMDMSRQLSPLIRIMSPGNRTG